MRSAPINFVIRTLLFLFSLLSFVPAFAQDRLFAGTGELGALGHFGERLGPVPGAVYGQFAAGGRYVASGTQAFDTLTGLSIAVLGGQVVGADPRRARVFVHDGAMLSIFDLDSRVVTPLGPLDPLGPFELSVARVRLASDADELVVLRQLPRGFVAPGEFSVIGATSPVTIPNAPPGTYYLRVRGTNAFGVSRPSNEIEVVVP